MFIENFSSYVVQAPEKSGFPCLETDREYLSEEMSPTDDLLVFDRAKDVALLDQSSLVSVHRDFLMKKSTGCWGAFGGRLIDLFDEYNRLYFNSKLPKIEVKIGKCSSAAGFGQFVKQGDHGILYEISVNMLLFSKGVNSVILSDFEDTRCFRLLADILLHQMVHAWVFHEHGTLEAGYEGHGPIFAAECNRIGTLLGLSDVHQKTKANRQSEKKMCNDWPYNVRESSYYGDLFKNVEEFDKSKKAKGRQKKKVKGIMPKKVSSRTPSCQQTEAACYEIHAALCKTENTTKSRYDFFCKLIAQFRDLFGTDGLDQFPTPLLSFDTPEGLGPVPVTIPA